MTGPNPATTTAVIPPAIAVAPERARLATAYHEAAHAVAAFAVGWSLQPRGIDTDREGDCLGSAYVQPDLATVEPWRYAQVALAGLIAERLHLGVYPLRAVERIHLCFVSAPQFLTSSDGSYDGDADNDGVQVAAMLLDQSSDASDDALMTEFRRHERDTWARVRQPAFWAAVKRVATALHLHGRLDAATVRSFLPDDIQSGRHQGRRALPTLQYHPF